MFIDSARFIASSFLNLVDNLVERVFKIKRKDFLCLFNIKVSMTI